MVTFEKGVKAATVAHYSALWTLFWIFVCYCISGLKEHTPWWLPMISDCAVGTPEKYPFRFGLIIGAVLLNLNSALMLLYHRCGFGMGSKFTDKLALFVATVSCICLALVGSINEEEDGSAHDFVAISFFLTYLLYELIILFRLRLSTGFTSSSSWYTKLALFLTGVFCLFLAAHFGQHFGPNKTKIAMCEWTLVFSIMAFNASFSAEYGEDMYVAAVLRDSMSSAYPSVPQYYQREIMNESAHLLSHQIQYQPQQPMESSTSTFMYPQVSAPNHQQRALTAAPSASYQPQYHAQPVVYPHPELRGNSPAFRNQPSPQQMYPTF